jgi:membrane-bound metal-dependent hydrolase YbcI (DUF457 family)
MDGKTHKQVGLLVGLGSVGVYRFAERKMPRLGEIAGAAFGGMLGAGMPDILEPATSSYHRGIAHGVATSAAGVAGAFKVLQDLRPRLDAKADELRARAAASENGLQRLLLALGALLVDFLNGLATGFVPGYVSHVTLDATTPRGIPLIA